MDEKRVAAGEPRGHASDAVRAKSPVSSVKRHCTVRRALRDSRRERSQLPVRDPRRRAGSRYVSSKQGSVQQTLVSSRYAQHTRHRGAQRSSHGTSLAILYRVDIVFSLAGYQVLHIVCVVEVWY